MIIKKKEREKRSTDRLDVSRDDIRAIIFLGAIGTKGQINAPKRRVSPRVTTMLSALQRIAASRVALHDPRSHGN